MTCPICGGKLTAYDRKARKVRTQLGEIETLLLRRLRCNYCQRLHTELPDFLVPYKRFCRESIEDVLACNKVDIPNEERTRSKIRCWYRRIRIFLDGIWQRLVNQKFASPHKIPTLLELVTAAVNSGFWTTHPNGRVRAVVKPVASS